jgi:hypothetical protein
MKSRFVCFFLVLMLSGVACLADALKLFWDSSPFVLAIPSAAA